MDLDYAEIEGELDGHPWIVANKGRLGFDYGDYHDYAPERAQPLRPLWLAARKPWASYQAVDGLDHDRLLDGELDRSTRDAFTAKLRARSDDPGAYAWLPVHPWQWANVVLPLFAAELAAGDLVVLGGAADEYLPQQSVRIALEPHLAAAPPREAAAVGAEHAGLAGPADRPRAGRPGGHRVPAGAARRRPVPARPVPPGPVERRERVR